MTAASSHPAYHDPAVIERVLADSSVWAVVGLGDDPTHAAYSVAKFLQAHGKRIVPVHPRAAEVLGEQGYRTLAEIPFPVDVVDIFRRSDVRPDASSTRRSRSKPPRSGCSWASSTRGPPSGQ